MRLTSSVAKGVVHAVPSLIPAEEQVPEGLAPEQGELTSRLFDH